MLCVRKMFSYFSSPSKPDRAAVSYRPKYLLSVPQAILETNVYQQLICNQILILLSNLNSTLEEINVPTDQVDELTHIEKKVTTHG